MRSPWPLDDVRVAEFARTALLRKRVVTASQLALLGFGGSLIIALIVLIGLAAASFRRSGIPPAALGIAGAFVVGLAVFYFIAWQSTLRSKRWAPLTLGIIQCVFAAFGLIRMLGNAAAGSSRTSSDASANLVGNGIGLLFGGLFIYIFFRGYSAIGEYLRQPAWCQELVITAERRK